MSDLSSAVTSSVQTAETPAEPKPVKVRKPSKPKVKPMKKVAKAKPSSNGDAPRCLCGCGDRTKGGRFIPGHDARLKGKLQTAFRAGKLSASQKSLINDLNWSRFMKESKDGRSATTASEEMVALGLSIPQVHIMKALRKFPNGLTRVQIEEKAGTSLSLTANLGPVFKEDVAKAEKTYGRKSLIGMKFVTTAPGNEDEAAKYVLTAKGRQALDKVS